VWRRRELDGAELVGSWIGCGWWWVFRKALCVNLSEAAFALDEVWVTRVFFTTEAYKTRWVEFFWC